MSLEPWSSSPPAIEPNWSSSPTNPAWFTLAAAVDLRGASTYTCGDVPRDPRIPGPTQLKCRQATDDAAHGPAEAIGSTATVLPRTGRPASAVSQEVPK